MASKKTGKKKARKKGRTAAQKAATAKLVAMNKGKKKASKKKGKKRKGSKKKSGKRRAAHKPYTGGDYRPHARYKPSVGEQFAGERGGQRFHGPLSPAQELAQANRTIARLSGHTRRKSSKKRSSSKAITKHHGHKHGGVVTAASILKGAKSDRMKVYVCAGKKFTGCGGGKKGAHVVGHLRG